MANKFQYVTLCIAILVVILELIGFFSPGWICMSMQSGPLEVVQSADSVPGRPLPIARRVNKTNDGTNNDNTVKRVEEVKHAKSTSTKSPDQGKSGKIIKRSLTSRPPYHRTPKPSAETTTTDYEPKKVTIKRPITNSPGSSIKLPQGESIQDKELFDKKVYAMFRSWVKLNRDYSKSNITLPSTLEEFEQLIQHNARTRNTVKKWSLAFLTYLNNSEQLPKARLSSTATVVKGWMFGGGFMPRAVKSARVNDKTEHQIRTFVGLWYGQQCTINMATHDEKCDDLDMHELMSDNNITTMIGGIATWNDLRIETLFALVTGLVGLIGTSLYVKPYCLKERRIVTCLIGICGMCVSCILQIIPIVRIVSIMDSIKYNHAPDVEVNTSWATIISGIGACFACLTSVMLMYSIWSERNHKWYKFDDGPAISFSKEPVEGTTTSDADHYTVCDDVCEK